MTDETPELAPKPPKPRATPRKSAGTAPARAAATGKAASAKRKLTAPRTPPPDAPLRMALIVAAAVIVLDQVTKYIVVHVLRLKDIQEIVVWEPFLNLRMAWNQGVNFGLFSSDVQIMRWVLVAVAAAVCIWVGVWLWRTRPGRLAQVAAGLLIGGALGNVIDRIAYGAVADFLNMSLPVWRNPYSFNVADIAIFAGALGLVFLPAPPEVGGPKRRTPPKAGGKPRAKTRDGATKTR